MDIALALLLQYKYLVLIPVAILEGPIVSILAGFLVSTGQLNLILALVILILGDALGDTALYLIGRWGEKSVRKHGFRIGVTETRLEQVKKYFQENHHKSVFISKMAHGIGFTGLIVAGILRVPYLRYVRTCFIITCIQTAVLVTLGFFFGHAYKVIDTYLNEYAAAVSALVLIALGAYAFFKIKKSKLFSA